MRKLYCLVNNLNIGGITYHKGDIGSFPYTRLIDQLVEGGILSVNMPKPKLDKQPVIIENKDKASKVKEVKSNGNKVKSKSRGVRASSEAVSEGLPGAESSD